MVDGSLRGRRMSRSVLDTEEHCSYERLARRIVSPLSPRQWRFAWRSRSRKEPPMRKTAPPAAAPAVRPLRWLAYVAAITATLAGYLGILRPAAAAGDCTVSPT